LYLKRPKAGIRFLLTEFFSLKGNISLKPESYSSHWSINNSTTLIIATETLFVLLHLKLFFLFKIRRWPWPSHIKSNSLQIAKNTPMAYCLHI